MRRLALAGFVAIGIACANIGSPPGGPTRAEPPRIVTVTPDSGAVNVTAERVTFAFDAVVSDRPGSGAATLEGLFLISPRDGTPRVSWERSRIEVRPRGGFRPNTAYAVTLLPGIADLNNNVSREGRTIIFSTGPAIPPFAAGGRVFDWIAERPAAGAMVEVVRRPDSTVFVGTADSLGQFAVGPLDAGTYTVRAFLDNNRNRGLDPTESWDSVAVTIRDASPFLELLAAPRDTIGPRILTAQARDSVTIALNFDRPLDPAVPLTPASFRVLAADSSRLAIARVVPRLPAPAASDSAPRDTVPARADTVRSLIVPRPSVPAPSPNATIQLDPATALRPGASYRVVATNIRGLLGAIRTSDRVVTYEPPPPAPTAPRDTVPPARP